MSFGCSVVLAMKVSELVHACRIDIEAPSVPDEAVCVFVEAAFPRVISSPNDEAAQHRAPFDDAVPF